MGLYVFGFGILGGILFSIVLTCYPEKMRLSAFIVCIASNFTLVYFYSAAVQANMTQVKVACSLLGFFLLPILFNAYELAVEQTAHMGVGENMSCGLINVVANFVGFLVAIALTPALDKDTKESTKVTFIVLFINLSLALIFLTLGQMYKTVEAKERLLFRDD